MDLLQVAANTQPTPMSLIPMLLMSLAVQRHTPQAVGFDRVEFDYIVVGAGSAGSAVASRLSELPCKTVLLLEAGGSPPLYSEVPRFADITRKTGLVWDFETEPQRHVGTALTSRKYPYGVGKTLGGSSTVNDMAVSPVSPHNYDEWAEMGADGWNYHNVTKYFNKLEAPPTDDPQVGVTVSDPGFKLELSQGLVQAAENLHYKVLEGSPTLDQNGFYSFQNTIRNGQRCSTAKAYLVPSDERNNLAIVENALVTKVIIENNRAVGVECNDGYRRYAREVIVSAGAINTPKLLMLSGIGPKNELERLNIPLVADLPVGENLQDHCSGFLAYQLKNSTPSLNEVINEKNINDYITDRKGVLSIAPFVNYMGFFRNNGTEESTPDDKYIPDYEIDILEPEADFPLSMGLTSEAFDKVYLRHLFQPAGLCMSTAVHPKSRGTVRLRSNNPMDPPLIDPNYLDDPKDIDSIVEGFKTCLKIFSDPGMRDYVKKPFDMAYPGCEKSEKNSDDFLRCVAKATVIPFISIVGTVKMGSKDDPTAVVDPQLRVKGVAGLRVVDASVMPTITWGHTNVPTIMIAEKASDMIKEGVTC